jgi:hypothetical protein
MKSVSYLFIYMDHDEMIPKCQNLFEQGIYKSNGRGMADMLTAFDKNRTQAV